MGYLYYIYYAEDRRHSEGTGYSNVKYKDRGFKGLSRSEKERKRGLW